MKKWTTLMLARAAVMAALYVALTFACLSVASGAIQFRISEALTILPLFYVEAIPALFIGCIIANTISACALPDILLGSLVTLVSAVATHLVGRLWKNRALRLSIGGFFPVALNALFLPLIWLLAYGELEFMYWAHVGYLFLSQGVIIWGFGTALYFAMQGLFKKNISVLMPLSVKKQKE